VVKRGKTPVLSSEEARKLLDCCCSENIPSRRGTECHLIAKPLELSKAAAFEAFGVTLIKVVSTGLQVRDLSAHDIIAGFENRAPYCYYRRL
jgi:hypothetical protein